MKKTKKQGKKASSKVSPKINTFGLKPLGDRVILQEVQEKEKNHSGIYIPESVKEDKGSKRALVIAVGPGRYDDGKLIQVKVRVGDTVLFQWGEQIAFNGREYFIVRENEIIAVVA